jgi:hypothetical protein
MENVRFFNRPVGGKRFQTIHLSSRALAAAARFANLEPAKKIAA